MGSTIIRFIWNWGLCIAQYARFHRRCNTGHRSEEVYVELLAPAVTIGKRLFGTVKAGSSGNLVSGVVAHTAFGPQYVTEERPYSGLNGRDTLQASDR